ncbi:hypothetical protein [Paenibacillus alba]|uniref:Uncharacterized protein n=1 Tax=Paenibacillus alba TaxID=1197127 RepID=A0ABU6G0H1_9BACL|nr:hypothetical protein [Paenibacillus alba]MEC0227661.1 hypothetical protein [Paenibacillus alba]
MNWTTDEFLEYLYRQADLLAVQKKGFLFTYCFIGLFSGVFKLYSLNPQL